MTATEEQVRTFIVDELNWHRERDSLTSDLSLIDGKVLDSLAIEQMVFFLESRFGVDVRDDEIFPSNFETIGAIARFVDTKRSS